MEIAFAGEKLILDCSGAVYWPAQKSLFIADLHLEKGSSFACRRNILLPPYDSLASLLRVQKLLQKYDVGIFYSLGDSFHDLEADKRLSNQAKDLLQSIHCACKIYWIHGNHDPKPSADLPGFFVEEQELEFFFLRHIAIAGHCEKGEISGHYHPKALLQSRGGKVGGKCFVKDQGRLLLPAFGTFTGGLSIKDPVISSLFKADAVVYILGHSKIHAVSLAKL